MCSDLPEAHANFPGLVSLQATHASHLMQSYSIPPTPQYPHRMGGRGFGKLLSVGYVWAGEHPGVMQRALDQKQHDLGSNALPVQPQVYH